MRRTACLLALLTAAPLAAQAPQRTGVLQGTVTDDAGEPLPGANVRVEGTTLGAATRIDGVFRIADVPVGTYAVTASFAGFEPQTRSVLTVHRGAPRVVDFRLEIGEIYGCPGLIFEPPILSNDPFASRVIGGEDLVRLPVR